MSTTPSHAPEDDGQTPKEQDQPPVESVEFSESGSDVQPNKKGLKTSKAPVKTSEQKGDTPPNERDKPPRKSKMIRIAISARTLDTFVTLHEKVCPAYNGFGVFGFKKRLNAIIMAGLEKLGENQTHSSPPTSEKRDDESSETLV